MRFLYPCLIELGVLINAYTVCQTNNQNVTFEQQSGTKYNFLHSRNWEGVPKGWRDELN
jgi:hypothetical protein